MRVEIILKRLTLGLAIAGILVAAYLSWEHLSEANLLCAAGGGCDIVRQSAYSQVAGVPVAVIGLVGYIAILAALILEDFGSDALANHAPTIVFGLSLFGMLYSAYLTYLELFVIQAVCPYCVASAVIITLIFGIAFYRLFKSLNTDFVFED